MDPKSIASDKWLDNQPLDDYGYAGVVGFLHVTTYNDGRKKIEVFQYGKPGEGDAGVLKTVEGNDPEQAAKYEREKSATQRQADQAERQRASTTLKVNPSTGRLAWHITYRDGTEEWNEASVPASAQAADANKPLTPDTKSPKIGFTAADGTTQWFDNPNYQKPNPDAISAPSNIRKIIFQNPDGTTSAIDNPNYQPPLVNLGGGRHGRANADGTITDVTPTSGASPIKPLGQQAYGRLAEPLSRALQDVYNDATLTNEEKLSRANVLVNEAKAMESEFTNQVNATRGIYGDQVQQRGQTLTDIAGRRALGEKSASMGYDTAKNLLGGLADPAHAGALMRMMIGLPGQQAAALGGMRDVPEIQLPVAAQQVLNTPLGGTPMPPGYSALVQQSAPQGGFLGGMTQQPPAVPSPQQDEYTRWLLSQGIPDAEQYAVR